MAWLKSRCLVFKLYSREPEGAWRARGREARAGLDPGSTAKGFSEFLCLQSPKALQQLSPVGLSTAHHALRLLSYHYPWDCAQDSSLVFQRDRGFECGECAA